MEDFTHFNNKGRAKMVDVSHKETTQREARARGFIKMNKETVKSIKSGGVKKGDVLSVAQVAGIMAAKKTSELIPMCHNIFITGCDIDFDITESGISVSSCVKTTAQTGVEMEALHAVSASLLTVYDMVKAIDKTMEITDIYVEKKTGGQSGEYRR